MPLERGQFFDHDVLESHLRDFLFFSFPSLLFTSLPSLLLIHLSLKKKSERYKYYIITCTRTEYTYIYKLCLNVIYSRASRRIPRSTSDAPCVYLSFSVANSIGEHSLRESTSHAYTIEIHVIYLFPSRYFNRF